MENDMEEQVKEQFEKFQNGWTAAVDTGAKAALSNNEVVMNSFSQLLKDQVEFGRACTDIGRKQLESLSQNNDLTTVFSDQGAPADYYAAATKYGEALRDNATNAFSRIATINREAAATFVKSFTQA